MKRISTLILAVFMVCGLFCVSSAAAERTVPWAAIGCGAAAIAVILLVVIFKKRKTVK